METLTPSDIRRILSVVIDPEIGHNIVDLGLIYGIHVQPNGNVYILLTFTSPTCPFADIILNQIRDLLESVEGVGDVEIEITFDPAWNTSMMSEEIQVDTGLF